MKVTPLLLALFVFAPIMAQDTTNQKVSDLKPKQTPEQIQFKKDVLYVVRNARIAYEKIDYLNDNVKSINNDVNKIITSNRELRDQNDSLKVIQNRILTFAHASEQRRAKAEMQKDNATVESESWAKMLDLTTIIGAMGAIFLLIGFNVYNSFLLNTIKQKLTL